MEVIIFLHIMPKNIFVSGSNESSTSLARWMLDGRDMRKPYPFIVLNNGVNLSGWVQK